MLPWLMERGEVSITEMAEHFSLTMTEVVADLELASMCGLPPFVDELIDVFIDDGMVFTGVPRVFTRPLRLTAPEGFALLIAGRAAMVLPGADPSGPLGRALDKLAAVLGDDGVVVEFARPPLADEIAAAAEIGERIVITYWTPSRDEAADREITP
ncbi:MAG: pafC, partial [Acidimicrobiales bacterium]|nr:pafC [Acidimicrobiales bacterium]